MDLSSAKIIKDLLKKHSTRPVKRLGQHFLTDKPVIRKIVEAADLRPGDTVLEIGSGIGTLTQELVKKAKKVVAIEKDEKMCEILREMLECCNVKNVQVVNKDILKINTKYYIQNTRYKVVANLPYYITSPVIRKFLELSEVKPPKVMVLMVQKEVAQRICAKPPKMSILAVSVQFYAKPEIISYVSKKSFWPTPKVDSAIIKIVPPQFRVSVSRQFREQFFRIVKAGFSQPRKQLINNLSKKLGVDRKKIIEILQKCRINPEKRAETLTINDWLKISKQFKDFEF